MDAGTKIAFILIFCYFRNIVSGAFFGTVLSHRAILDYDEKAEPKTAAEQKKLTLYY